jgi:hypothetical protein
MIFQAVLTRKLPFRTSFSTLLASGFELLKDISESGDITLAAIGSVAGMAISAVRTPFETYREA